MTHSYILKKNSPPLCEHCQCILTVRHILVECNNFAQDTKDIFGRRDVVESFKFHPTIILLVLKQIEFYYTFLNNPNCDKFTALYTVFYNVMSF